MEWSFLVKRATHSHEQEQTSQGNSFLRRFTTKKKQYQQKNAIPTKEVVHRKPCPNIRNIRTRLTRISYCYPTLLDGSAAHIGSFGVAWLLRNNKKTRRASLDIVLICNSVIHKSSFKFGLVFPQWSSNEECKWKFFKFKTSQEKTPFLAQRIWRTKKCSS